jgi:hypothetical protein
MALARWVGSLVSTSVGYACGSSPFNCAERTKLMTAAARRPARNEPANSQFERPIAQGRIWFSVSSHSTASITCGLESG